MMSQWAEDHLGETGSKTARKTKTLTPDDCKDDRYWEKRKRNNEAARKSREMKRKLDSNIKERNAILDRENIMLKQELNAIKAKYGLPIHKSFLTGEEYEPESHNRVSEDSRGHASDFPMHKRIKQEGHSMHEVNSRSLQDEPHMMSRNVHSVRIHDQNNGNRLTGSSLSPSGHGHHRPLLAGDQGFASYMMQPNESYWDHNQGNNQRPDSTEQSDVHYHEARHNSLPQSLPNQPYNYRYNHNNSQYGRQLMPTDLSKGEPKEMHNHTEMKHTQEPRFQHQHQVQDLSANEHFRPSQRLDGMYDGGGQNLGDRQHTGTKAPSPMKQRFIIEDETTTHKNDSDDSTDLRDQIHHLSQEVARMKDYIRVPLNMNPDHK